MKQIVIFYSRADENYFLEVRCVIYPWEIRKR